MICPLCKKSARSLTSLGVCPWCDDTQGETPDPDSKLGRWLAEGREGPAVVATEHLSCLPCRYHSQSMYKSGLNPIYHHYCGHPDVRPDLLSILAPGKAWIGESDATPHWCPFLQSREPSHESE